MSASDHLGPQFRPVSELLDMRSGEAWSRGKTVRNLYNEKAHNLAVTPRYAELDKPIMDDTIDPVLLSRHNPSTGKFDTERVVEGHHRIVRAHQLGKSHLPVSYTSRSQVHEADWYDRW